MPGLITLFRRHSAVLTNFKDIYPESRPYWVQEGHIECEELGVRRGPGRALECPADAETHAWQLVGPWQYQCSWIWPWIWSWIWSWSWVVPLPRYPPGIPPSRYPPTAPPSLRTQPCSTAVLGRPKEILGVEYALDTAGTLEGCVWPCQPPYAL